MILKKTLSSLYIKVLLLAFPFIVCLGIYVYTDPFMVIKHYDDYDHPTVMIQSEGPIAWYKYKSYRDTMHYDSFIMGSSCTMAFQTSEWKKYIKGSPFRFFSNSEGLGDLLLKLEALDRQPNQPIKNLLIVAEPVLLNLTVEQRGVMHIMPPEVSGRSIAYYQTTFLQGFFRKDFFTAYMTYLFKKKYDNSMNRIINNVGQSRTRYTNDEILHIQNKIDSLGEQYYQTEEWKKLRANLETAYVRPPIIKAPQKECLLQIQRICKKHNTNVKIAIGPDFKPGYVNSADVKLLKQIFGENNVLNYNDAAHSEYAHYSYFYDSAHYNTKVAEKMLYELYRNDKTN
ncbi:MAG: hypothetical protein ACTTHI_04435 [Prevotella sp.]